MSPGLTATKGEIIGIGAAFRAAAAATINRVFNAVAIGIGSGGISRIEIEVNATQRIPR